MIYLYYGKIGDGKTYHVVSNELIPAVRAGRKIYTNIDGLSKKHIGMLTGKIDNEMQIVILSNDQLKDLLQLSVDDKEGLGLQVSRGALIIVDEAQMIWDAREFRDTKKTFLTFLEYHRHFGLDIVFITQNVKRLESSISRLCNESYQVKNLKFLGGFLKRQYVLHIRQTPHDREKVATIRGSYRNEIFLCYRSYVASSKFSKKTKAALQGFVYYATAIMLVLGVSMFVIRGGFSFFSPDKVKSMTATKGGANANTNNQIPDFVYSDSSGAGRVAVPSSEGRIDIGLVSSQAQDDCMQYKGIRGKGYIRRGDTVLVKDELGVWRNKSIDCVTKDTAEDTGARL